MMERERDTHRKRSRDRSRERQREMERKRERGRETERERERLTERETDREREAREIQTERDRPNAHFGLGHDVDGMITSDLTGEQHYCVHSWYILQSGSFT